LPERRKILFSGFLFLKGEKIQELLKIKNLPAFFIFPANYRLLITDH